MKRACLFCLMFALSATAVRAEYELTGGIVYSDGKSAIYYAFATESETNLTADLQKAVVKSPIAASADGEWLAWRQDSKFWVRQLPKGTPYAIQYDNEKQQGTSKRWNVLPGETSYFVWQSNAISNMALSPDGTRFSFDAVCQKPGWVLVDPGKPDSLMRLIRAQGMPDDLKFAGSPQLSTLLPLYAFRDESFCGIFYLSTIYNSDGQSDKHVYEPLFGNVSESPDSPIYRASSQDMQKEQISRSGSAFPGMPIGVGHTTNCSKAGDPIYYSNNIKKSARFLTFSSPEMWTNGKKLVYFIYQIGSQWGPIEIRLVNKDILGVVGNHQVGGIFYDEDVVTAWEIPVSLTSCEGLAVRPDGSLSVQSNGNLYLVEYSEIERGMASSRFNMVPDPNEKREKVIQYVNNVFKVRSTPIARGLAAKCLQWVSNDSFLFLGRDNAVWLWKQGATKKLRGPIPSNFCYCLNSPINTPAAIGHGTGRAEVRNTQHRDTIGTYQSVALKAGYIRTNWGGQLSSYHGSSYVEGIRVGKVGHQPPLEFCLTGKTEFKDVDLSKCQWQKIKQGRINNVKELSDERKENDIRAPLGFVIALRQQGSSYCAMMLPKGFELRWKSWDEAPGWVKSASNTHLMSTTKVPPYSGWLLYDWESRVIDSKDLAPATVTKKLPTKETRVATHNTTEKTGSRWSHTFEIQAGKKFSVGSLSKLEWLGIENEKALLYIPENEPILGFRQDTRLPDKRIEDIDDPSQYFTRPFPNRPIDKTRITSAGKLYLVGDVMIARYSKLPDKYFAVQLVEIEGDRAIYKKRCWPDNGPSSPKVAPEKQP